MRTQKHKILSMVVLNMAKYTVGKYCADKLTNDSSDIAQYSTNSNAGEQPARKGVAHTHTRSVSGGKKYVFFTIFVW